MIENRTLPGISQYVALLAAINGLLRDHDAPFNSSAETQC